MRIRWDAHVARIEENEIAYECLVRKSERNGTLGKPKFKWRVILRKTVLKEIVCEAVDWICTAQKWHKMWVISLSAEFE
jgi:hypothetical protein